MTSNARRALPADRRRGPAARALAACLALAVAGYAALAAATLLARWHWAADLATHFRPHYLAAAAALAAAVAAARVPRLLLLPLAAAAAVHAAVLLRPVPAPEAAGAAGPSLRLTTFNVLADNAEHGRALAHLRAVDPDVLVLQEVEGGWYAALMRGLADRLPYTTAEEDRRRADDGGGAGGRTGDVVVMSRHPILAVAAEHPTGPRGRRPLAEEALRVELSVAGRRVVVWAVHPVSPLGGRRWRARNAYLGWVADRVAAEDPSLPVIVAGDFNQTPWTPWHRAFLERAGGLVDAAGTSWPAVTRRPLRPGPWRLLGVPIDRVAVRPGIGASGLAVGPGLGSDHFPVTVDLTLEGAPPRG
jgi:endonuclease/exonuclease/phosphatase (EEP) superfamily protein YafD